MKVLFIHHGTILGGAPLSLLYLVRELERQPDMELEIVCHAPQMRDFFAKNLKSPVNLWQDPLTYIGKYLIWDLPINSAFALKTFLRELFNIPKSILKQARAIKEKKPDIVHLNSSVLFTSAIAARLAGIPIIWHVRECLHDSFRQQRISAPIIRRLADRVIAISEMEARLLGDDSGNNIQIIYNPINFDALNPAMYDQNNEKKKLGLGKSDKLVISLGGVNPRKGTLEQVEAMRYTDAQTKLIVAGPPLPAIPTNSYEHKIAAIISGLPKGKVVFAGMVENVAPLLAACDLLLFTGMKSHFPRPMFEAWRMKKPVIVFEMDGISNNVDHQVDGIIVKEISGKSLGEAISNLLQDPSAMQRFGEAGSAKAERKCDPVSVAEQVMNLYKKVLS
jgi:glycosyltransferase involved in cell wall biosynthesis